MIEIEYLFQRSYAQTVSGPTACKVQYNEEAYLLAGLEEIAIEYPFWTVPNTAVEAYGTFMI